jgi:hypothetical protein
MGCSGGQDQLWVVLEDRTIFKLFWKKRIFQTCSGGQSLFGCSGDGITFELF